MKIKTESWNNHEKTIETVESLLQLNFMILLASIALLIIHETNILTIIITTLSSTTLLTQWSLNKWKKQQKKNSN